MATRKTIMPPDCCGSCIFSHDMKGQEYLLCQALPPIPIGKSDDGYSWVRGGYVEANDPRCWYFHPKTKVN